MTKTPMYCIVLSAFDPDISSQGGDKMPDKVIPLDNPGRKLIIRGPETRRARRGADKLAWAFLLDEAEYRRNNAQPFEFCAVFVDRPPEEIARAPKNPLHNLISSMWLDERWIREIEPQIISFITEGV